MKIISLSILFLLTVYGLSAALHPADNIVRESADGIYNVELLVKGKDLKLGRNTIDLLVRDRNGEGIEGAGIILTPWMPEMGHGVDIKPVVKEKGQGLYTVDSVYISMSGQWELRIEIEKQGVKDNAVFDFARVGGIEDETGMDAHVHHMAGQSPVGVMGGHTHHAGKWMVSYRYMYMDMHGNRSGSDRVEISDVHKDFIIAPTEMNMQMHMVGIMYAPSDKLTLMTMIPHVHKEMDHVTRTKTRFTTRTDGIGDIKLTALYQFYQKNTVQVHINAGLSLPTGSIDEKGHTPAGRNSQLPYPMQLGSGTFDLLPGITCLGSRYDWSWGSQVNATIRLGKNDNEYALGDEYGVTLWVARKWTEMFSTSLRADGRKRENIEGADPDILTSNMMGRTVPTANPALRGGERIDILLGLDLQAPKGKFEELRLAFEGGFPVYQHLNGPQLETDWLLTAGMQWSF